MSVSICNYCGVKVERYEDNEDKGGQIVVLTISQMKVAAFWCEECNGVICAECAGLSIKGETVMTDFDSLFCPACKGNVRPANEQDMKAPFSEKLRAPKQSQGFLSRLFRPSLPPAGSFAYLFAITQKPKPTDNNTTIQYTCQLAQFCVPDIDIKEDGKKIAVMWETHHVDRVKLISLASETFGVKFKEMSTKFDLSIGRTESSSGTSDVQFLIARNR